jgi:UDP-N-acetylglucosamine 2-epimerase (non-hydrolysing)
MNTERQLSGNSRLRVVTIVGTRPEIIKLSRVIAEMDRHVDHILVHSGQNYDFELNEIFFRDLQIRPPDHHLGVAAETAAETIGQVIIRSDALLRELKPNAVLIYGDTNTCLAAISAKRQRIPVFHMEAGNRCFDARVPEEINRKIVDHVSDINLTITEHARRYLLAEGLRPETIIKVGSSMKEVLAFYRDGIEKSRILEDLSLAERGYFVFSSHREENVDVPENRDRALECLRLLVEKFGREIIVSTHPRTRMRLQGSDLAKLAGVRFLKPFGFLDYIALQKRAFCVISDSGTLMEECSLLKYPAVLYREAHERPEGMDAGTLIMSGLEPARVVEAVRIVTEQAAVSKPPVTPLDYETEDVARKVVRIVLSYADYVRRTVWQEGGSCGIRPS